MESTVGASSSRDVAIARGTAASVVADEDTTEGVHITEVWVPGNRSHQLADHRRFAPQVCFTYHSRISIFYALGTIS